MIKSLFFDIGGTLHVQEGSRQQTEIYEQMLFKDILRYGICREEDFAALDGQADPKLLLSRLEEGAGCYKKYAEDSCEELPGFQIWREYLLKAYKVNEKALREHEEDLSYAFDRYRKELLPRPGLKESLVKLRERGIRLGIISNIMSRSFVPRILEEYGIRDCFEVLVLSSISGIRKPDPEIFRKAEAAIGLGPEELGYVGDTISRDVRGTRNAGWKMMIQIDNPRIIHKDLPYLEEGWKADYRIGSLEEIPAIIENYNRRREGDFS